MVDKTLYPFESRFFDRGGLKLHYLDEGAGLPVVMVHGNPSWSFYYRELVKALRPKYRTIVPDHIGMGLSEKPGDDRYEYTLKSRVDDLEALLEKLGVRKNITLVLHDWGGMIGMAYARRHPQRVNRLVILNTAAFFSPPGKGLPWTLRLCRTPLGAFLIRGFNAFSLAATYLCAKRGMSPQVRSAFVSPYGSWKDRIATLRFVQDIPLSPADKAYSEVDKTQRDLPLFIDTPVMICWGGKDFVFDDDFLAEWIRRFPNAKVHRFPKAGHYVLEDEAPAIVPLVSSFLKAAAVLLFFAWPALAGSESNEQRAKDADEEGFFSSAAMSFTVDDNVHRLSTEDMAVYRTADQGSSSAAQARFNRMVSLSDTVYRERGGFYEQSKPFGDGFANRLGMDLDYVKYYQNTIKDHPVLRLFARQYFTDKHYLEISFSNAPDQFERNYIGRVSGLRRPGSYYTRAWRFHYDGRFEAFGGFGLGVWAQYSWDRYAEPELDYRNAVDGEYGGYVNRRWTPAIYTEGGYRYRSFRAVGGGVVDSSNVDHQWYIKGEWVPWRDLHVTAGYKGSFTHYLTAYPLIVDPFYAGRRDFIDEGTVGASYPLGDHLEFWAEFSRAEKRTNITYSASDEFLHYIDDTYSLGIRTRWNFGWFSVDL